MTIAQDLSKAAGESLPDLSLTAVSALIARGDIGPVAATEAMLARIAAVDGRIGAYTTVMAASAMAAAERAEGERARGLDRGPLHGVPIAVKDLCRTTDAPTSAGMSIYADYMADADCTLVTRLKQAGAVILGKLTMTEGAFADHHPSVQVPLNPFSPGVWSGASSSGSGAAAAAGLAYGTLGSDTGGSIRFPSAACGITGLKPTWGRVSRAGVFALADSLDHVGPMARTAMDCAIMMGTLAGVDPRDPTTLQAPVPDYVAACAGGIRGMRIGIDRDAALSDVNPEVAAAMEEVLAALVDLGAVLVPVTLPDVGPLNVHWNAICAVECALAHAETYPSRKDEYGPLLSSFIDGGHATTTMQLGTAMQARLVYNGALVAAMAPVDALFLPVVGFRTPTPTEFRSIIETSIQDLFRFSIPANLSGLPSLTMPAGFDGRGGPIGFQLMGPALSEAALMRAGHAFQSITDWHTRRPDLTPFKA